MGEPIELHHLPHDIQKMFNDSWSKYQINEFVANLIPLDRELPDMRTDYCKNLTYPEDQPPASIIMVFHNEALSMILRTVVSILNFSPPRLLKDIVLVDDCSTHGLGFFYFLIFGQFLNLFSFYIFHIFLL
jgi:hypothetical protein